MGQFPPDERIKKNGLPASLTTVAQNGYSKAAFNVGDVKKLLKGTGSFLKNRKK
ncbi:MAG: hypothetical protein OEW15_13155 [Nitrospirota bacterium]|nr:hypothetical protein [Nitrospirota bacterium]